MGEHTEDILSDNNPEKRLRSRPGNAKQSHLAKAILSVFKNVGFKKLSEQEKELLWDNIHHRAIRGKNGKKVYWRKYAVAASVAFFMMVGLACLYHFGLRQESELLRAAKRFHENMLDLDSLSLALDANHMLSLQNESTLHFGDSALTIQQEDGSTKVIKINQSGNYTTMAVPYGKRSEIILPDSTKVWLNAGSYLTFAKNFVGNKREVYLQGEAFFEVTHLDNKPFFVYADDMQIKVLGTSFNVSAYKDDLTSSMSLIEGTVELSSIGDSDFDRKILAKGITATINKRNGELGLDSANVMDRIAWTQKRLVLKSTPLSNLIKSLERVYNADIEYQSQKNREDERFSGIIDLNLSLYNVLLTIFESSVFEIHQEERRFSINKR